MALNIQLIDNGTGFDIKLSDEVAPTVTLNTPADSGSTSDTTPVLDFTGTDGNADDIRYNLQLDTVDTFDSQTPTLGFPSSDTPIATNFDTSVTSMPVNLPSSIASGNLLIAITETRNPATFTSGTPSGWIALFSQQGGGLAGYQRGFYKIADGSEGATATWTASVGTTAIWQTIKITNWHGTTPPEAVTDSGDATSANPPSITPSWGATDTLFLAIAGHTAITTTAFTAAPSNYSGFQCDGASSGGSACSIASSYRELNASSEDPGTFTVADNRYWTAATIAIRPATTIGPLLNEISGTDAGFANPDNGSDTDPFTSAENIQYTVQTALALGTYYWRVRGIDPSGSNAYGAWSATRSFTITSGSSGDFVIQDESSASSIDNITLEVGGGTFTVADESSASSVENIALTQAGGTLSIADESSASSIENITLQFQGTFEMADETSTSSIDNITIERNGGDFVVADAVSSSSVENISIQQSGSLLIADIETTSSIENITLEVGGGLFVVENESSPSSIDNITLEQNGGTLAVGDITSTSEIDNIALIGNFIIGDVVCETTTEEITLEFEGATLIIEDIASTSTVENIPLIGELIIQDINAPPTIENITLEIASGDFVIGDLDSSSVITNIRIVKNIPDELKTIFIVNRGKVAKWISGNNYIEL